jgi:phosphopantetheinyl transferase
MLWVPEKCWRSCDLSHVWIFVLMFIHECQEIVDISWQINARYYSRMGACVFHCVQSRELRDWEMLQYFGGGWGHFFTYWSLRDAIRKVQADDARYKDRNVEATAKEKIRSNGVGDWRWREVARMFHHLEYTSMEVRYQDVTASSYSDAYDVMICNVRLHLVWENAVYLDHWSRWYW